MAREDDYITAFFKEHREEIDKLKEEYEKEGKIVPGNTFEEVSSLEEWLEMLRRKEEQSPLLDLFY